MPEFGCLLKKPGEQPVNRVVQILLMSNPLRDGLRFNGMAGFGFLSLL
jgi:hypothetical protein